MKKILKAFSNFVLIIYTFIGIIQFIEYMRMDNMLMSISNICVFVSGIIFLYLFNSKQKGKRKYDTRYKK